MATKKSNYPVAQAPLLLSSHRLMEAFAKSNDEREFFLDRVEGFIIYVDLDKAGPPLDSLYTELSKYSDRYVSIPKLTFFETKKIMEGFVNEKVYDVDTKEKLMEIIHSKDARENFLEFIYDHHSELEKWQQYYQERSRIRIIEWLRNNNFHFVFEEDLDIVKSTMEKLKHTLFQTRVAQDVASLRKVLATKAKTYYSSEALNPRPKRGRPPKQAVKQEVELQVTVDLYTQAPESTRPFLFTPEFSNAASVTFSAKFEVEEDQLGNRRNQALSGADAALESLNEKLASLRGLSSSWLDSNEGESDSNNSKKPRGLSSLNGQEEILKKPKRQPAQKAKPSSEEKPVATKKATASKKTTAPKKAAPAKKPAAAKKPATTGTRKARVRPLPKSRGRQPAPAKKTPVKAVAAKKKPATPTTTKKRTLTKLTRTKKG